MSSARVGTAAAREVAAAPTSDSAARWAIVNEEGGGRGRGRGVAPGRQGVDGSRCHLLSLRLDRSCTVIQCNYKTILRPSKVPGSTVVSVLRVSIPRSKHPQSGSPGDATSVHGTITCVQVFSSSQPDLRSNTQESNPSLHPPSLQIPITKSMHYHPSSSSPTLPHR